MTHRRLRQQWYQLVEFKQSNWSILAYFEFKSSRRKFFNPGRRKEMIDFQNYLDYEPTLFTRDKSLLQSVIPSRDMTLG